ncbi:hypothetical protein IV203_015979 [Nitzschia inconspicua]|uniref:Uncharacterized protein n=1 Tax=Nitzschia inconspicua TaxID=303405 RepID=A0A9K3KPY7_9STRA|nr:hypothetical protein IV203_015979 [Nitzschia inconspicua]
MSCLAVDENEFLQLLIAFDEMSSSSSDEEEQRERPRKRPFKHRKSQGVVMFRDNNGELKVLPPTISPWYNMYSDSFATSDSDTRKKSGASAAGRNSMRKAAAKMEDQKRETSMLDGSGRGVGGQESMKLQTFALRAKISTAMTTNSIVNKYNAMKISLDKQVALIRDRKNAMEKLVFQKPKCFDDHEHYYATYVPYKVYMDSETELQELTDKYKDLDDQMIAEIEAMNQKERNNERK